MSDYEQTIDYDGLTKDALRGVAKQVLIDIEKHGLPGEHHLFISFDTTADGVIISKRLREEYPNEMTIVLQHRFWDLEVHDDRFQVKLTFNAIPERLTVPYKALKVFYDPSVPYGLQFVTGDMTDDTVRRTPVLSDVTASSRHPGFPVNPEDYPTAPLEFLSNQMADLAASPDDEDLDDELEPEAHDTIDADEETSETEEKENATAEIVELDQFRKR